MDSQARKNKTAWEYDAYQFWIKQNGPPAERAKQDLENPRAMLRKHQHYFDNVEGLKIANICGSCGKKAVPLRLLGADVSVFDISEANRRYACETAEAAGVSIDYVVGDVMDIDLGIYASSFDIVFMEGGVLHYFNDIRKFMQLMHALVKDHGKMICSDFHPLHKVLDVNGLAGPIAFYPDADYFSIDIQECEVAHARFYGEDERKSFPKCSIRRHTLSEIINAALDSGFLLTRFDEHPGWTNNKLPGEFTMVACKSMAASACIAAE